MVSLPRCEVREALARRHAALAVLRLNRVQPLVLLGESRTLQALLSLLRNARYRRARLDLFPLPTLLFRCGSQTVRRSSLFVADPLSLAMQSRVTGLAKGL